MNIVSSSSSRVSSTMINSKLLIRQQSHQGRSNIRSSGNKRYIITDARLLLPFNNHLPEHNHQRVITPFPWRERPMHNHYNDIQFQRMQTELTKYQEFTDFLCGGLAAFQCAVTSIFQHHKLKKQRILPSNDIQKRIVRLDKTVRNDIPPFVDIFDTFLSRFFEQSIDRFVNEYTNHQITYELLRIQSITIFAAEYIMYSSELAKKHPYLIMNPTFGDKIRELKFIVPSITLPGDDECIENSEVLRVWVNIDCEELFVVKNNETNEIVQGDVNPTTSKHQILLESCVPWDIKNKENIFLSPWKIVDIDNWLDGNKEVWLKRRVIS